MNRLILLVAQGLGTGLSPTAPGTVGTLLGLPLFILLLLPGNFGFFVGMLVFLAIASVYFCERAEVILNQRDPGSIVIDEIVAVPLCFAGWVSALYFSSGVMPEWSHFFSGQNAGWTAGVILLFRIFDIAKPWPVGPSQSMPKGWGVTMDDLLAALYVNIVVGLIAWIA